MLQERIDPFAVFPGGIVFEDGGGKGANDGHSDRLDTSGVVEAILRFPDHSRQTADRFQTFPISGKGIRVMPIGAIGIPVDHSNASPQSGQGPLDDRAPAGLDHDTDSRAELHFYHGGSWPGG